MEGASTCKLCNISVGNRDNYCSTCGESLDLIGSKSDKSQSLVFLAVTFLFGTAFIWFAVDMITLITGSYDIYEITDGIGYITRLLIMSIGLMLALSMKNGVLNTLAVIFASVYTLIELYWYIKNLIP